MRNKRRAALAAVAVAGSLFLAGCTQPYQSAVIEDSEITLSWNDIMSEYNTNSTGGNSVANSNIAYLTTSHFNYYNNKPELQRNTGFGRYQKVSDDPLTIEYVINDDVVWSDGVPVDSADMLLAWAGKFSGFQGADGKDLFLHANPRGDLARSVPETDDKSLTLRYDRAFVDWEVQFDVGVPAHATVMMAYPDITDAQQAKDELVRAIGQKDMAWLQPVAEVWNQGYQFGDTPADPLVTLSSGPYKIEEVRADEYVTVVANDKYTWGPSPKYQRVTIREIPDPTAQVQALQNGEIQIAGGQPTADVLKLVQGLTNVEYSTSNGGTYEHLDLTFDNGGPFDAAAYGGDEEKARKVRQAFLLAVPRQEIVEKLIKPLNDKAQVRNSLLILPGAPGYEEMTTENGSAAYSAADIEKARALLAEAGVSAPVKVGFWYPQGNVRRGQQFELIAASAARAGFELEDQSEPNWRFTDKAAVPVSPHDAALFGWQATSLAVSAAQQFIGTGQPSNYGGYSNPEVDRLLAELESELDPERQLDLQLAMEKILWQDGYGITLFQHPELTTWSTSVAGVASNPLAPSYFWNFWEWEPAGG